MDMAGRIDETVTTLLSVIVYVVQGKKLRMDMQLRTREMQVLNAGVKSLNITLDGIHQRIVSKAMILEKQIFRR